MDKVVKFFDKYAFYLWAIVILLVGGVFLIPFTYGNANVFGLKVPFSALFAILPMLMGIFYAFIVSCEEPKMSKKKKVVFRTLKLVNVAVFYAITISAIAYASKLNAIKF